MQSATPDFDFDELCRLAELYTLNNTTNPLAVLQRGLALSASDRTLLEVIVERTDPLRVAEWKSQLAAAVGDGVATGAVSLSKEEYMNVAKRDFERASKGAVLNFMIGEKRRRKS